MRPSAGTVPWAAWHDAAEAAIRAGAVHFCFTPADRAGLESVVRPDAHLIDLPPFIDAGPFRADNRAIRQDGSRRTRDGRHDAAGRQIALLQLSGRGAGACCRRARAGG